MLKVTFPAISDSAAILEGAALGGHVCRRRGASASPVSR